MKNFRQSSDSILSNVIATFLAKYMFSDIMNTSIFIMLITIVSLSRQSSENIMLLNSTIMKTENHWRIVNDGVMGGLSSSKAIVKR